jgi:uncharacterized protein DUF3105
MVRTLALVLAVAACGDDAAPLVDAAPIEGSDAGGCLAPDEAVANEGWDHVDPGTDITYGHNPPASGPHYDHWARYMIHEEPLPRGNWVHNLEHGAIVLLHRSDAPAQVQDALLESYDAIPPDPECGHRRALVAIDDEIETPIALVAADVVRSGDCVDRAAAVAFTRAHRNHGNEDVCRDGDVP